MNKNKEDIDYLIAADSLEKELDKLLDDLDKGIVSISELNELIDSIKKVSRERKMVKRERGN